MAIEIYMPKMSDHMEVGEIVRWLALEGEAIEERQPLLEVMTDKVVAVVEAPASGILSGIRAGAQAGAKVPVGQTIAYIAQPGDKVPSLPALSTIGPAAAESPMAPAAAAEPQAAHAEPGKVRAAPAARALARELGLELALVRGTGPEGRIRVEDVRAYHEACQAIAPIGPGVEPSPPTFAAAVGAGVAEVPAPLASQRTAESMPAAAQLALTVSVDMGQALALCRIVSTRMPAAGEEPLPTTAILIRAAVDALTRHPQLNATCEQGQLRPHERIDVCVAVGTGGGLLAPVIRDAGRRTLGELAAALKDLQERARAMRLTEADVSGGTFTVWDLGLYGVERFAAVVDPPQSAILAAGRIVQAPAGMPDGSVALRPLLSLTLSVDRRSVDALQAAGFIMHVKQVLEQPYLLL